MQVILAQLSLILLNFSIATMIGGGGRATKICGMGLKRTVVISSHPHELSVVRSR
jgi:hypothetical protein